MRKYISLIIAFLVLALAVFIIFEPKVREYNSAESKRQARLKAEANGEDYKEVPFEIYSPESNRGNLAIVILTSLFLSLLFTRRILLSFLFILIFCAQIFLTVIILPRIEKPDWWFDYSAYIYFDFLLLVILLALSFWLALSTCRTFRKNFNPKLFWCKSK